MGWNIEPYVVFLIPQWYKNSEKTSFSELELCFLLKAASPYLLLVFPWLLFPKDGPSLPGLVGEVQCLCRDYI